MIRLTPEQKSAVFQPGNLIVSAAAGAGKTAVLTERVFRLIADGTPVRGMLILTFTRAAAAEMKTRIQSRLMQAAEVEQDDARRGYFCRQANEVLSANISTIDAFCQRVVFRHFHVVGLSPAARTMDETESAMLRDEVLDASLGRMAEEQPERYRLLLYALDGEPALKEAMLQLQRFLEAQPDPEAFLAAAQDGDARWASLLECCLQDDGRELSRRINALTAARDLLPPECAKAISVIDGDLTAARGALLQQDIWDYLGALSGVPFDRISYPKGTDESDKAQVQSARDALKKCVRAQIAALAAGPEAFSSMEQEAAVPLAALMRAERDYLAACAEEKRRKNVLDFSDLEHFCDRILSDPLTADEYREQFSTIIVDEYQDSNRVQEQILSHIRRADNLFFVGDVKQSIYGFRSAEPSLFLDKLTSFSGEKGTRIDLSANFRSSQQVLDAVNAVFSRLMTAETGSIVYDTRAELRLGRKQPDGLVECHVIDRDSTDIEDGMKDAEAEARHVGSVIAELMQKGRLTDPADGRARDFRYDDFVILMRSKKHARTFAQTLSLLGIPCFAQLDGGYFDSIEVMLLLALLRVIDNRRQDIPLLAVMRSDLGGFSDAELVKMRAANKKGTLLDCLLDAAKTGGADCHAATFLARIDRYRAESRLLSTEDLIARVLDDTGLYEAVGAIAGGAQRQANLDALIEKAHAFDQTGACGIHAFLSFMDRAERTSGVGAAQLPVKNVVRIMSIHKSKGLEFPAVFLCGLGAPFRFGDAKNPLLLHGALGAGLRYVDADHIRRDPLSRRVIARRQIAEQREEELRVLYVAMTRAMQRLYLIGCVQNAEETVNRLPLPSAANITSASSFLRLLLPTLNGRVPLILHKKDELVSEERQDPAINTAAVSADILAALTAHFAWEYPFSDTLGLPDKTSVTQLGRPDAAPKPFDVPAFLDQQEDAAARGTAVHRILERLPLKEFSREALATRYPADAARHARELAWISRFTATPLYARMAKSPRVEREWSFSYPADTEWLLGVPSHERVLLQGVMDACFVEDGAWVLLDYKTDDIADEQPEQYAEKHRRQVTLYGDVLSRITGMPVKEAYLVLLRPGAAVRLW